jgi:hypothetical protein
MIALCTGAARLEQDGDRYLLNLPSGTEMVQVSLTRHQARALVEHGRRKLDAQEVCERLDRSAEIIALRDASKRPSRTKAGG